MNVYPLYDLKCLRIRRTRAQDWVETYYIKFSDGKYRKNYCLEPDSGALIQNIYPMVDSYISRKVVIELINKQMDLYPSFSTERSNFKLIRNKVEHLACADVAPVWHGRNITELNPVDEFICSECGAVFEDVYICKINEAGDRLYYAYTFNYCPSCGAKMKLGKD